MPRAWSAAGATFAVIGLIASGTASSAQSAEAKPTNVDRMAYEAATRCYVLAGNAYFERKKAGDMARANAYEQKAHAAFDLAVRFGRDAGRNGSTIEAEILEAQQRELPKLVKDVAYNRQTAATCRALGLL